MRLEARRFASIKGATTEFRKMESLAFNPEKNALYLAMSELSKGMTDADEKADIGGRNDVRLPKNACGVAYELALDAGFTATTMTGPVAGNECDIDGIANPDNVGCIAGYNTLLIGEDTGKDHQNDAVWSLDLAKGNLVRIMTTPYGSEATSLDWYPNVNGHADLMSVVQHPYGESDVDKLTDPPLMPALMSATLGRFLRYSNQGWLRSKSAIPATTTPMPNNWRGLTL